MGAPQVHAFVAMKHSPPARPAGAYHFLLTWCKLLFLGLERTAAIAAVRVYFLGNQQQCRI